MPETLGTIEIRERDPVTTLRIPCGPGTLVIEAESILAREDVRTRLILARDALSEMIEHA